MANHRDIINKLTHSGAAFRAVGIADCVKSNIHSSDVIELLVNLKSDNVNLIGCTVSQSAIAALDVLGVEKYEGDDSTVISLIQGFTRMRSNEYKDVAV